MGHRSPSLQKVPIMSGHPPYKIPCAEKFNNVLNFGGMYEVVGLAANDSLQLTTKASMVTNQARNSMAGWPAWDCSWCHSATIGEKLNPECCTGCGGPRDGVQTFQEIADAKMLQRHVDRMKAMADRTSTKADYWGLEERKQTGSRWPGAK